MYKGLGGTLAGSHIGESRTIIPEGVTGHYSFSELTDALFTWLPSCEVLVLLDAEEQEFATCIKLMHNTSHQG
jgi:hypothetical protein